MDAKAGEAELVDDRDDEIDARIERDFQAITRDHGPALRRLARGYEAEEARREDLFQEILVALWRALPGFEGRSSLRTWVFRVAHNVAATYVVKRRRDGLARAASIDDLADELPVIAIDRESKDDLDRLAAAIRALRPADAQIVLLYLEGFEHAEIGEVTGLSREAVAVRVHRLKAALAATLQRRSP